MEIVGTEQEMLMQSDLSEFNAFYFRTLSDQSEPSIESHWPIRGQYLESWTNERAVFSPRCDDAVLVQVTLSPPRRHATKEN